MEGGGGGPAATEGCICTELHSSLFVCARLLMKIYGAPSPASLFLTTPSTVRDMHRVVLDACGTDGKGRRQRATQRGAFFAWINDSRFITFTELSVDGLLAGWLKCNSCSPSCPLVNLGASIWAFNRWVLAGKNGCLCIAHRPCWQKGLDPCSPYLSRIRKLKWRQFVFFQMSPWLVDPSWWCGWSSEKVRHPWIFIHKLGSM